MKKFILLFIVFSEMAFAKDLISITAVGDIMMGGSENEGSELFKPAESWIKNSDVRFGNFEGTFFDGPNQPDGKSPGPNRWIFKTPIRMASTLSSAGFNVVSLANNHVKDYGQAGINSTKETLKQAGIQFSSKAGEVAKFKVDQTEISLIAVDFYKAPRSMTDAADTYVEIQKLKQQGHLVIVSAHVGGEGNGAEFIKFGTEIFLGENRGDSVAFARAAIDSGADVILMHGPHVPRGLELYKNRMIAYSLGNFVTGRGISIEGYSKVAPLLRLQIDHSGQFRAGQLVSFVQRREPQRIEFDNERTAQKLISYLSRKQFPDSPLVFEDNGTLK
jgi:poly-gamma-glutamate capsule biosynthesis protein CapA/YwtB (metallophosphatase superfamily)